MRSDDVLKSTQEQAVAAWINYLNVSRFQELAAQLAKQDINFEQAMTELQKLKTFVSDPRHILGSLLSKHGEIAEHVQVNFVNAEHLVAGEAATHTFEGVGRTAAEDYLFNGKMVQAKVYFGTSGTLQAIVNHLDTYPWFLKDGGTYDIAHNHYQALMDVYNSGEAGTALTNSDFKLYEAIKEWETANGVKFPDVVHPMVISHDDVQMDSVHNTINAEEAKIADKDQQIRDKTQADAAPTLQEGLKATAVAAVLEGGVAFAVGVYRKRKEGKKITEFTEDDWKELGKEAGIGTVKGAIRGGGIYVLANFASTPAPVASALITATFGMLTEAYKLQNGDITGEEFVEASEAMCLNVSVSALSSILGQALIPVPVLGAIIGNTVGMFMTNIANAYLSAEEQKLIASYQKNMEDLDVQLSKEYNALLEKIDAELRAYESMAALAFDEDVNVRFESAVGRARAIGIGESRILTQEAGDALFTSSDHIIF